jgi:transcriptional regulator with XRE-family HTH domain
MAKGETTLATRLKALRMAAGLTQQELAHEAKLSISLLAQLEQGRKKDPRVSTILSLAHALGCTADSLIWGLDEPSNPKPRKK